MRKVTITLRPRCPSVATTPTQEQVVNAVVSALHTAGVGTVLHFEHRKPSEAELIREYQATSGEYDLLASAAGINSSVLKVFEGLGLGYKLPGATKTYICEFYFGQDTIERYLGNSMHVFLPSIPQLEFAALIPKGDYATLCVLGGEDVAKEPLAAFLGSPEFDRCLPGGDSVSKGACQCSPRISVGPARRPFGDRLLFIGDCGVTRLYKDGIGAAYRTAKAAANAAVFEGISVRDFEKRYWPACRALARDNRLGGGMFRIVRLIQRGKCARRALLGMVDAEQRMPGERRYMSMVLWNLFTGSEGYREIFLRTLHPVFLGRVARHLGASLLRGGRIAARRGT